MNWYAIGLRRLDTVIWALIALVAAFTLSVAARRGSKTATPRGVG